MSRLSHDPALQYRAAEIMSAGSENSQGCAVASVRTLKLKPEDLPIRVRFDGSEGIKDYVLLMTRQGKLLLNKPTEGMRREDL